MDTRDRKVAAARHQKSSMAVSPDVDPFAEHRAGSVPHDS
jgi:hypothetical protein